MHTYVALLRSCNVVGHNRIAMNDLRALFTSLGCRDAVTYIQSGNVVFKHSASNTDRLTRIFESGIADYLGLDIKVLIRTPEQLANVHRSNPYLKGKPDLATLHVTYLSDVPGADQIRSAATVKTEKDRFAVVGREVFLHCPNGYGRTKLNNTFFEKRFATTATTRNWRTLTKLLEMSAL